MTVSYQYEVASSTSGGFTRLLFMWRGSLYKLIYRELLLFLVAFCILSALYRNAFTDEQKRLFERVVIYCDTFINLIPLSFVLGFYVAYVAGRWWQQYMAIPWPDKIMHSIALYVNGNDDHARMTRRTLLRYLNVTLVLVLRSISSAVKRRFPTLEHLVEAGFLTPTELQMYQSVPNVEFNTYWIPCTWFVSLLKETRKSNKISDPIGLKLIMEEFNDYRAQCGLLWSYDWVSIPLVYTQVVTIATYTFFMAAVVGRQFIEGAGKSFQMEIDIYLPVFTILQFFFYMGLLKVAEQLINPFGDDDEDFELNWLIDRHTKVSYLGVDALMSRSPPLVKDMYFNELNLTLPYTEAAVAYKRKTYRGSVHNMVVPEEQHVMFLPEITEEDEEESHERRTPKSSILSLHSVGPSPSGPTEGTWRKNSDKSRKGFPLLGKISRSGSGTLAKSVDSDTEEGPTSLNRVRTSNSPVSSAGSPQPTFAQMHSPFPPSQSSAQHLPAERTESVASWRSFLSSLGARRSSSSNNSSATDSRRSSTSSISASPKPRPRPRLQSCPKLVITVGRHNSTGSTSGRKKGVRWKPVLDDGGQKGSISKPHSCVPGRIPNRRSAPDLCRLQTKLSTDSGYVRDESFWRGGKFPGTPPLTDYHHSGSRFLRKMMFWKADGNQSPGAVEVGTAGTAMGNVAPTVTRSLPNIAVHGVSGTTSKTQFTAGPYNV